MDERLIIWAVATLFYSVAIALAAFTAWLAAGATGAALTVAAAVAAAVWAVTRGAA